MSGDVGRVETYQYWSNMTQCKKQMQRMRERLKYPSRIETKHKIWTQVAKRTKHMFLIALSLSTFLCFAHTHTYTHTISWFINEGHSSHHFSWPNQLSPSYTIPSTGFINYISCSTVGLPGTQHCGLRRSDLLICSRWVCSGWSPIKREQLKEPTCCFTALQGPMKAAAAQ